MLDETLEVSEREAIKYDPIPKDIYPAELLDITAQTKPTFDTKNKPEAEQEMETVMSFQFVLLDGKDGDKNLRGRSIWYNYVPDYLYISAKNGKNKLFRATEALLARPLTQEDKDNMGGAMLNTLVGKQCRLSIEPVVKGEKTYNNITDCLKAGTLLNALTPEEKEKATPKEKGSADGNSELKPATQDVVETIDADDVPFG